MEYPDLVYYEDGDEKIQISEHLKQLTLYNFFHEIDNEFKKKNESIHCEKCNEMLNVTENSEPKLLELCKAVCYFILNNNDIEYFCNGSSCNNSCSHMKFRLHDHVMKDYKFSDNIIKFYEALGSISKSANFKLKDCPIGNYNLSKDEFMNFKYLYEFFFNYIDIRNKISKDNDSNKQLYCKYIKNFFQFYNKIKDSCPPRSNCKYYNILEKLKNEFITYNEINNVYDKCNYEKTSCKEGSNLSDDIPCLTEKGNRFTIKISGDNPYNIINILFNVLIYLISILTTFTLLYKFTPLGSLLRSRMNKRKNILEHVYENNYDHLGNISKDEVPNFDSRGYNVLYQSDKNI
ncbi:Plasmodium vivax Vir protein, putative [Plasmodium vivax]|uniref:Vir protein, putative n=1 Tax=Plasmodium vivax TaxID=5855 RepID=A0A1G4EIP0_PLAVI|nr:Plasmodium vivax Vir protein, putative [Plasmodium vivax]